MKQNNIDKHLKILYNYIQDFFYGIILWWRGRSNPDFIHKVRVKKPFDGMIEWCDNYPTGNHGYFKRYYVDWRAGTDNWDSGYAIFQFEWEEPAILFALTFGAA